MPPLVLICKVVHIKNSVIIFWICKPINRGDCNRKNIVEVSWFLVSLSPLFSLSHFSFVSIQDFVISFHPSILQVESEISWYSLLQQFF